MSLVCGSWNSIAKLETAMQNLGEEQDVTILIKRTPTKTQTNSAIPYQAQIIGLDDSIIINEIISFFTAQKIAIENLLLETAVPTSTATPIFNLNIDLSIPTTISIHNLRNDFLTLCEELNVDGMLDPAARI
jgi:glycine cleavage system transcriptional repressor